MVPLTESTSPAKRIALFTYGSRGDVEPFVALGVGLQNAGYAVRLAAPAPFAGFAARYGLDFAPIEGNPDELAAAFANQAGLSWVRMIGSMARHVMPIAAQATRVLQPAAQDADLIVHSFLMTDAGHTLARRLGVPDVSVQFFPIFLPTGDFTSVALPDLPLGRAYRRWTHHFNTALFRWGARAMFPLVRRSAPDFPALAPWFLVDRSGPQTPLLFAYSRHVLPPPADWPPFAHVTGYWRLPPPAGWLPPPDLVDFLQSGAAPVYFGPGSMQSDTLHDLLRMAVGAARACRRRILLGVAPHRLPPDVRGDYVFAAADVPHAWLFPRMAYIVHHGGAGTSGAAVSAGVPNSAAPFSADQAFWARRLHQLRQGPAAPPARRLTLERLTALMQDGLQNPVYARAAAELAGQVCAEDGVAEAVRWIQMQWERQS